MIDRISLGILPKPNDPTGEWASQRDPETRGERLRLYALNRERYCLKLAQRREQRKHAMDRLFRALAVA